MAITVPSSPNLTGEHQTEIIDLETAPLADAVLDSSNDGSPRSVLNSPPVPCESRVEELEEMQPAEPVFPTPRYDSPQAVYRRYVPARDAWYAAQPKGSIKTNQQYRRAMRLPLRYDKQSYNWCLDYKQMGKSCATPQGPRDWSKEEMMAYLDWSKAEDKRVEAQVSGEMTANPMRKIRGVKDIWKKAEEDSRAQQVFYSAQNEGADCIIVQH